jgi:hypothetical protein
MIKIFFISVFLILLIGCNNNAEITELKAKVEVLQAKNDSLQEKVEVIKPGLGDLMLMVQVHHNKLWFAGKEDNWPLAQFEHDEIMEILKQAQAIETDRKEIKLFPTMIYPQLDSLQKAIASKDNQRFNESFTILTTACNNCHKEVNFSFNKIKIPEQPPYSNQDFSTSK